jgi:hypothetical protein
MLIGFKFLKLYSFYYFNYVGKLNFTAKIKYPKIKPQVKLFKVFSAELGEPNKLLFVAKLVNPPLLGVRIKIIKIKKIFKINQINFSIYIVLNLEKTTGKISRNGISSCLLFI